MEMEWNVNFEREWKLYGMEIPEGVVERGENKRELFKETSLKRQQLCIGFPRKSTHYVILCLCFYGKFISDYSSLAVWISYRRLDNFVIEELSSLQDQV